MKKHGPQTRDFLCNFSITISEPHLLLLKIREELFIDYSTPYILQVILQLLSSPFIGDFVVSSPFSPQPSSHHSATQDQLLPRREFGVLVTFVVFELGCSVLRVLERIREHWRQHNNLDLSEPLHIRSWGLWR